MNPISIFLDKELRTKTDTLDFGTGTAGDTKQYEFYIKNESLAELKDLKFSLHQIIKAENGKEQEIENAEVVIISAPQTMAAKDVQKMIIEWKPSVTLKQKLTAKLEIKGFELYK